MARVTRLSTLLLFACSLALLDAKSTKAELFGILRDPAHLPVASAAVELIDTGTGARQSVTTQTDGSFHLFALSSGTYQISVVKNGFTTLHRDGLMLRAGDRINLDLDLQLGDVSQ